MKSSLLIGASAISGPATAQNVTPVIALAGIAMAAFGLRHRRSAS